MITEFRPEEDCTAGDIIQRMHLPKIGFVFLVNGKRVANTDLIHKGDLVVILPLLKGGFSYNRVTFS